MTFVLTRADTFILTFGERIFNLANLKSKNLIFNIIRNKRYNKL